MSYKLTIAEKLKIENKVKEIELLTQGEIVPCIISKSDNYPVVAPLVALSLACIYLFSAIFLLELEKSSLFIGFLIITAFGFLIGRFNIFKRLYLHPSIMRDEVHQFFIQTFFDNKLHYTIQRTGILIGISLLERRMEILVGKGIADKIDIKIWNSIIDETIPSIKKNNLAEGIITAIDKCGKILIKEFPAQKDNPNELSDKLITDL